MWQALRVLSAMSDLYLKASKLYRTWKERTEARAEVAQQIGQKHKDFRDATSKDIERGLDDNNLDDRLQTGKF